MYNLTKADEIYKKRLEENPKYDHELVAEWRKDMPEQFAKKMGDKPQGVPYTIIGNKSFNGYGEQYNNDIINAIISQYKNSYDVYFSK